MIEKVLIQKRGLHGTKAENVWRGGKGLFWSFLVFT